MKDQSAVLKDLKQTLAVPTDDKELASWLDLESSLGSLARNVLADTFTMRANSVLVSTTTIKNGP